MTTYYVVDVNNIYKETLDLNPFGSFPEGSLEAPPATTLPEVAKWTGDKWEVLAAYPSAPEPYVTPLEQRQHDKWEAIKTERDRRKYLGVKVADHWFHSDDPSRIQQLALAMMGASIPAGLQWKTLTLDGTSIFVEMTPTLAQGIFQATAASDATIFAAAEAHRLAMEASESPETYDFSQGWPVAIEVVQ